VNDNAPKFSQPKYEIEVPERTAPGSRIYRISAWDSDQETNARISFKIFGGPDASLFELMPDQKDRIFANGTLASVDVVLRTELDFEAAKNRYAFQVIWLKYCEFDVQFLLFILY